MTRRTLTVDALVGIWQPTPRVSLHLSPDGTQLIVTVQSRRGAAALGRNQSYTADGVPIEMVGSRVLVIDTAMGMAVEPFPAGSTSWGAQWSPEGTRLAAYVQRDGPACLRVWECGSRGHKLYHDALVRPFFGFEVPRWTPDGRSVVAKLITTQTQDDMAYADEDRDADPARVFSFVPGAEQDTGSFPGWEDRYRCDLARVDVETGAVRRLVADWS